MKRLLLVHPAHKKFKTLLIGSQAEITAAVQSYMGHPPPVGWYLFPLSGDMPWKIADFVEVFDDEEVDKHIQPEVPEVPVAPNGMAATDLPPADRACIGGAPPPSRNPDPFATEELEEW